MCSTYSEFKGSNTRKVDDCDADDVDDYIEMNFRL